MDDLLTASLEKLTSKLTETAWLPSKSSPPSTVYHYTDAAGLFGILSSKSVRATDCRFMNDSSESEIGIDNAKDLATQIYSATKDKSKRAFFRQLLEILRIETKEKSFIFSLSDRADDLSQWRSYANEGEGFTIGFRTDSLLKYSNRVGSDFGFGKVNYNVAVQSSRLKKALQAFEDAYFALPAALKDDDALHTFCIYLDGVISTYAATYKHSSFRAEHEWRINSYVEESDPDGEVKVRVSRNRLVPYIDIELSDDPDNFPITHVGIGPGFKDSAISYAVEKLLRQTKVEAEVYLADTPYRRV